MSRLDAIVLAAGSLGLAANVALSQPGPAAGVVVAGTNTTSAVKVQPIYRWTTDSTPGEASKFAKR